MGPRPSVPRVTTFWAPLLMTTMERGLWCGCLCAVMAACGNEAPPTSGTPSASVPSATVPPPVPPPPYGPGPWARASAGDVQAHRRLAELHDGERLAAWATRGPRAGVALEALAYADDAELAFGSLADMLASQPERRLAVLDVVYRIALRPPRSTEALDPPGLLHLLEQLGELASEGSDEQVRSRALSAWRAFARAGYTVGPPDEQP